MSREGNVQLNRQPLGPIKTEFATSDVPVIDLSDEKQVSKIPVRWEEHGHRTANTARQDAFHIGKDTAKQGSSSKAIARTGSMLNPVSKVDRYRTTVYLIKSLVSIRHSASLAGEEKTVLEWLELGDYPSI